MAHELLQTIAKLEAEIEARLEQARRRAEQSAETLNHELQQRRAQQRQEQELQAAQETERAEQIARRQAQGLVTQEQDLCDRIRAMDETDLEAIVLEHLSSILPQRAP